MKNVQKIDLGLTGYDELFANDEERKVNKLPRIFDIPISEIDDFPDHPFKVKIDEDMDQLVQSIKERGIITPVTLRPKEDGRYEIVSGHRRKKACELAGLDTVKAEVREMSRDEAIILMVESNLQRSTILPSEKAFSYKMRLEAMNRQGQRTDLTSTPVVSKSRSNEELGSEHKEGIVIQAWYPLGHGDKALIQEPLFTEFGKKYGKSNAQIILRWHIQAGNIVIPGSKNPAHIKDNFNLFDFALTDDEMAKITALDKQKRYYTSTPEMLKKYAEMVPPVDEQK